MEIMATLASSPMEMLKSMTGPALESKSSMSMSMSMVAMSLLVIVVLATLLQIVERRRKKLPPGPMAWPVVGNFPAISGALPHHVLRRLADKYGGLMYLRLGSVPTIVVSTVSVSKALFQAHDATFLDRPKCMYFDIVTDDYKNMAVSNGRYWRQLRKLCASELFTAKRLATYQRGRAEEIQIMIRELVADCCTSTSRTTGKKMTTKTEKNEEEFVVNLKSWLLGITSNNMTRMLINKRYFGSNTDAGKKEKEDFEANIANTFKLSGAMVISDFIPYLGFVTRWQGWPKKMEQLREETYNIGSRMLDINKHRELVKVKHDVDGDDENHVPLKSFLEVLLQTPLDDGQVLPDNNLILILMLDLISGGTETSATVVEWGVAELVRQPVVMRKLQSELDNVIGMERVVEESDLPKLPFLHAVVKETLRLHPPAALNLPRESSRAFTFQGYRFPKHTRLILNFHAIHRDPSIYGESAEAFNPERFMERPEVNAVAGFDFYELTPFSAGRRMCPAADMGYMMVSLMLAHLMHAFEWELPFGVDEVDMDEQSALTVSMKTALQLVPKPRRPAFLY